ncbi:hypothetical protein FNV43_RR17944 [Rhamnella rubrinervis]|uniref:Uncharacterized protein n=1 Tax=Rhamnella rubrinervis TaxID=2594499 RepID=A0A8K0E3L2_9ROSA|nr:hypothetical protein FNV43_RR17944 [Rhamnella rubrinervis]
MGRRPCCEKEGLNRGAWSAEEDNLLLNYIQTHGQGKWRDVPHRAGLKRCGKSCRLRWLNYLRPDIKRGNITIEEEDLILRLHKLLGNRWSLIAGRLPGRTDNEIKNYWNTTLSKRVLHPPPPPPPPPFKTNMSNQNDIETTPHVVRTKAIKCTKVVLNYEPPHHHHDQGHKVENFDAYKQTLDTTISLMDAKELNIGSSSSSFSTTTTTQDISSADFILNFNLDELCLLDLLNSDFSDMCDFNYSNINIDKSHYSKDLSLPNSKDQAIMSSEEMLQSFWSSTS